MVYPAEKASAKAPAATKGTKKAPKAAVPAAPPPAPAIEFDILDQLARKEPREIIALMLWKERHRNPELAVQITEQDITGFQACVQYLDVKYEVKIERPAGRPARPAIPPSKTNPNGWPPAPAEPPRNFVFVGIVEKGTVNGIKPIENNEDDAKRRDQSNRLRRLKETGPGLAREMVAMARSGTYSSSTIEDAAQALIDLAALA